tara:strand:+ start:3436 stop:4275 length:840 start_codon:yes stop_codon:yes gene_type:complete
MGKVYIVGNGYIGDFLSNGFKDKYHFVGICRSTKRNCDINISLDISKNKEALHNLIELNGIIVYLAAPQKKGLVDTTLSNFLTSIKKCNVEKIIYISTSGVYGDKKDRTVNEQAKLEPITDRAIRRVDAENQIKCSSIKYTILRVPGIYGANRLPIQRVKERMPLIKNDICKHTNLIHAKDLSSIIENCISNEKTNNITMNVSDGTPIKTTDYYLKIYDALKIDYPEFIDYEIANKIYDEKRKSFINESRILDVSRLNELMPDIIRFRDVTEGIKDCLQ